MTDHTGTPTGPPPGWYNDPRGPNTLRWWDGTRWGEQTQAAAPRERIQENETPWTRPVYEPDHLMQGYDHAPPRRGQVAQAQLSGRSTSTAMWAHLGSLLTWAAGLVIFAPLSLFCFVTPLIIRGSRPDDIFVRHHATQSLNSCFTGLVLGVAAIIGAIFAYLGSGLIGAVLVVLAAVGFGVARAVCEIIGAIKANHGERYTFPVWVAFRFIRDNTV